MIRRDRQTSMGQDQSAHISSSKFVDVMLTKHAQRSGLRAKGGNA